MVTTTTTMDGGVGEQASKDNPSPRIVVVRHEGSGDGTGASAWDDSVEDPFTRDEVFGMGPWWGCLYGWLAFPATTTTTKDQRQSSRFLAFIQCTRLHSTRHAQT